MHSLKKDFEKEIKGLRDLYDENDDLRKEVRMLRDQLFSGTSVLESRKSVELSAVTILQGHNIKLLTLVGASTLHSLGIKLIRPGFHLLPTPDIRHFRFWYDKYAYRTRFQELRHCDGYRVRSIFRLDRISEYHCWDGVLARQMVLAAGVGNSKAPTWAAWNPQTGKNFQYQS